MAPLYLELWIPLEAQDSHCVLLRLNVKLTVKHLLINANLVSSNGMESLQDILSRKDFKPPDELAAVKEYVRRHYKSPCQVKLERNALILSVRSSGLAATLFLERQQLIEACGLTHRLVIKTAYS